MKIIHCADLHLDAKMTANLSKEQAKERKIEILRTFSRMVDYAKANGIEVILIAGDLFDTRNVTAMARNTVYDKIVSSPEIDFLYLKGNHDNDNFLSKMDVIPSNLCLFAEDWTAYRYGNVVISGIELTSRTENGFYHRLALNHEDINIVTMHGQMAGYRNRDHVEVISLDDLRNKNIDYLALGHIHEYKQERLDQRGIWCYPGCLEGRGFDECGEKGFVVLDIQPESRKITTEFVPFGARSLYTVEVDVTGITTTQDAVRVMEDAIAGSHYPSKSLMKFILTGEVDVECELDTSFLEDHFAEYYYFEKIYDKTKIMVNYADFEKDASLKGEFVRMVNASDLSEEDKSKVIRMGLMALAKEEI
ncbi:MAG: DNA repair exonuclease [Agathobacter sp.]|nr:DNA repair exonuclease [Agathobacter sp.]